MPRMRSIPWLVAVCFLASSVQAQEDDDLAPLVPNKVAPKKAPPPRFVRPPPPPAKKAPPREDDDLAPLVAAKTELMVRGQPGSTLSIDGKEIGALPQPAQALAPGEHQVMVKRRGWSLYVKKVMVPAGKTLDITATMQAVNAVVAVNCDVPGADVLVNGRVVGTTPLADLELPASAIELEVRKDDFKPAKQRLVLVAGREYPVSVKLRALPHTAMAAVEPPPLVVADTPVRTTVVPNAVRDNTPVTGVTEVGPSTPITSRWYFWAGVGVVVIGAGVGVGLAVHNGSQPAKPPPGTTVCNGKDCNGYINYPAAILPFANGIKF